MRYQTQALELIKKLPKFDKVEFEEHYSHLQLAAGGNNVFQYLDEKKRWIAHCLLSEDSSTNPVTLSAQAQGVVSCLEDFDEGDFKRWFSNSIAISTQDVMAFIEHKEKLRQHIIRPNIQLQ